MNDAEETAARVQSQVISREALTAGHEQVAKARELDAALCAETQRIVSEMMSAIQSDREALARHGHSLNPLFEQAYQALLRAHKTFEYLIEMAEVLKNHNAYRAAERA